MHIKPFYSYEKQIEELKKKGILLEHDECLQFLQNVNYYRFSAYLLPYKNCASGLSFSQLRMTYEFDSELRSMLVPIIERIEIMFRSRLSHYFAEKYGAEGYLDEKVFSKRHNHEVFLSLIEKCIKENSQSLIIKHHEEKYEGHYPLWVLIEFFSMGMLSYFFSDMNRSDKKALVKSIGYPRSDKEIESWLRCLTILRNKCAHYARLYYAIFTSVPMFAEGIEETTSRTLYPQLLMLRGLLNNENAWTDMFIIPFQKLMNEYKETIKLEHLGFSDNWYTKLM